MKLSLKTRIVCTLLLLMVVSPVMKSGGVISGTTTCPASGSKAITATSTPVSWVVIQNPFLSSGSIYVGQSGVTTTTAPEIKAGGSITLSSKGTSTSYDLGKNVYFACANSGDSVTYVANQ